MVPVSLDAALVGLLEVGAAVLGLVLVVAEEADRRGHEGSAADQLSPLADQRLVGVAVERARVEPEPEGLKGQD